MKNFDILEQYGQLYKTHPFYYATYADEDENEPVFYRHKVCVSGRGSGKTTNIALCLLLLGGQTRIKVLCAREIQNSIQDSVHKVLKEIIEEHDLGSFYKVTDKTIRGLNGTEFIFKGLYNNLSSIKGIQGIDICWIEEAESVSQEAIDVLEPTIRKEHSEIWWSFNPRYTDDPVYTMFIVDKENKTVNRSDALMIETSYQDNPFLSQTIKEDVERMKERDYNKYLHVYEGHLKTQTEASIFADKWRVDYFNEQDLIKNKGLNPRYGLDWGFSADPNAFCRIIIDEDEKIIYVTDGKYAYHTELDYIPQWLRQFPGASDNVIIADKSRPETISYCRRHGFPLMRNSANKKIEDGITFLLNYDFIVHPNCTDAIEEFKKYSYKVNPQTNQITNKIGDKDNHFMDAMRYACDDLVGGGSRNANLKGW